MLNYETNKRKKVDVITFLFNKTDYADNSLMIGVVNLKNVNNISSMLKYVLHIRQ